jgi:hypothetical protein
MVRHIAWMCMILAATAAQAQETQWLQYRSAKEPHQFLGGAVGATELKVETEPPAGVKVLKFASDRPLFAKWITPMAPAGYLWLALDQSGMEGAYDHVQLVDQTRALDALPSIEAPRANVAALAATGK